MSPYLTRPPRTLKEALAGKPMNQAESPMKYRCHVYMTIRCPVEVTADSYAAAATEAFNRITQGGRIIPCNAVYADETDREVIVDLLDDAGEVADGEIVNVD